MTPEISQLANTEVVRARQEIEALLAPIGVKCFCFRPNGDQEFVFAAFLPEGDGKRNIHKIKGSSPQAVVAEVKIRVSNLTSVNS